MAKKRLKSTPGKVIDCFGKLRAGTDMAGHPKSAARLSELEKSASAKASGAYKRAEKAARADGFADPNWKEAATTAANDAAAAVVTRFRTGVLANVKALESAAKKAPKVTAPQKSVAEIKAELKQDEQWILDDIDAWLSGGREGQPADGANYSVQENVKRLKGGFDAVRAKIAGLESKTAAAEAKAEPEKPAELMSRKEWVAKNGPAPLGRAENAAWHSRLDRTIREAISQKLPVSAELAEILPFNEPIPVYGGETYLENNGYVREGDQYVYRPKESAGPDIVEGMLITESAVNTPDGTKKRWMVQTDENKQRVANGERELGGNGLYSSREEAVAAIKQQREMERLNAEAKQASEERSQKEAAALAEKEAPLNNFLNAAGLDPMAQGKLKAALKQPATRRSSTTGKIYNDLRYVVIGQMIEDGYSVDVNVVDKVKDLTGRQSNRMTNEEQSAFERRKAQSGLKSEYTIKTADGEFVITKAEYDYGKWYQAQKSAAPEKVGSGAVARLSEGELRSMDAQSLNDYADRIEESAIEKASAAAESAQGFRFAGRWNADAVLSPTESGQVAALRDIALWKDASMKSKDGSDIAKKQMDGSISRYLDGSARTKGHENALRLTNVDQPAYSAAAVDEFRSPIANDPGFTKIGDYYIYTAGKEVPPPAEGSEGRDVATASPEPVPSGAPAKNLPKTDTKPANVKNENSAGRVGNRGRLLVFDKPIQTPAGKILSYQWQSQLIEEVDSRGEEVVRRISDWDLAEENADTGKSIVHHFLLERPDGTRSIVSLESAIGVIKGAQEGKTLKSRIAAARRLVVRQAELAQAEADLAEYERIVAQVKQEPVPQGEFVQDGNRRYSWMVDGSRVATMMLGHDAMKERIRTLDEQIQSEPRFRETEWQAHRVRQLTSIPAYKLGGRIADLKQLIKRDQQKMGGSLTVAESQEKEAAPDPYRPSGNDFPSAGIEPTLPAAGESKSISKKASQASDLVIPRKADGTLVDPIRPTWDDKSRMDAEQYGYVTDGKKLYIIDRQKSAPMQEAKPATTFADEVSGKWNLYVREYAEDGTQGKSKRMPIPENTLYPVKSSEKWYQRKAEMESEKTAVRKPRQKEEGPTPIEPEQTDAPETEYFAQTGINTNYGAEYEALERQLDEMTKVNGKSMLEHVRRLRAKGDTFAGNPKLKKIVDRMAAIEQETEGSFTWTPDDPADTAGAEIAGATGGAMLHPLTAPSTPVVSVKGQSEIIRDLAKALKLPIRFGRLTTPKYAGYFKKVQDLIGLKRANDIPSVAHEVGHKVDALFDISSNPSIARELDILGDPATPNSRSSWTPSKNRSYKLGEGVGEFIRYWLIEPATATRMAPATEAYWNSILDANPDFADSMRQAQYDIKLWREAPASARIDSSISIGSNPNKTRYRLSQMTRDLVDDLHVLRLAMDDYQKLNGEIKPSENFYLNARLLRGSFGMAGNFVQRGVADFATKKVTLGTSLEDALKPVAGRLKDFRRWIVSKRAQELHRQGRESGLVLSDVNEDAAAFDGDPVFEKAFEDVKAWQDSVLQYCVDAGYVTQESADKMREMNRDYVPFHRVFEIGAGETPVQEGSGIGRGMNVGRAGSFKGLRGSFRDIVDPIETMIKNAYTLITAAEKSNVSAQIAKLANKEGMGKWVEEVATPKTPVRIQVETIKKQLEVAGADMTAVPDDLALMFFQHSGRVPFGENIIKVTTGGVTRYYRLNGDLFETFHSLNNEDSSALFKFLSHPAQILRAGVTLDPAFTGANLFRDAFGSAVINRHGLLPFQAAFRGIKAFLKDPDLIAEWAAAGGEQSFEAVYFDRVKLADFIRRNIAGDKTKGERVVTWMKHPILAMRYISGMGEMITRIGEYKTAYEAALKGGMSEGDARRQAAFESRDRQDFSVGGAKTRQLRQVAPFWNAGVQGNLSVARAFRDRPWRTILQGFAYVTLPTLALMAINHDDEDYWDRPQWERDLCWLIPIGKDANGRTEFMRLPKPFIIGQIFGSTFERAGAFLKGRQNPYKDFAYTVASEVIPKPMPTFLTPIEAFVGDRGFVTWKWDYLVPRKLEDVPAEYQVTEQTSLTARKIGKILGFSPLKVDHIITSLTGGIGKQVVHNGIDSIISAGTGEKPTKQNVGMFSRFFSTPAGINSAAVNDFYQKLEILRENKRRDALGGKSISDDDSRTLRIMEKTSETISSYRRQALKESDMVERQKIYLEIVRRAKNDLGVK